VTETHPTDVLEKETRDTDGENYRKQASAERQRLKPKTG